MVMPTVQPSWRAWATIWSVVCLDLGRRIFGMASISSTVSKSFIPIGIDRRCRYWLSPLTIASQSYVSVVMAASCRVAHPVPPRERCQLLPTVPHSSSPR